MKFLPGLILVMTVGLVSAGRAQIMSNPSQWYINNQIYSMRVFNGMVGNSMLRKGGRTSSTKRPPNPATANPGLFKAGPNILPARLTKNAANAAETQKLLDGFVALYKQTAAKDGFPSNDVAYAFQYFVVNNYQIYYDLVDVPADLDPRAKRARDGFERIQILNEKKLLQVSPFQEKAIFEQFRSVISQNAELAKMPDSQKQEAAEVLAIMFGVNFAAYMQGIKTRDETLQNQARQAARDGLEKLLGASIDRIKITNSGLEIN